MRSNGYGKKQERANSCPHARAPSSGNLGKTYFLQCKNGYRGACGCRKAWLKCSVICTNCNGTCDDSQVPLQDSDEEEETESILEQTYDGIEEQEDINEADDPITDDVAEISICDISLNAEDDELAKPGPSRTARQRRMR